MTNTTLTYSRTWNSRLDDLPDPPADKLYARGEQIETALTLDTPTVAIVGARACSDYGAHVARRIAAELAASGVTIVSGLARGIDGWAHRGALEAGGRTVAILGCGIDRDYPRAHAELARQIVDSGGGIVSEYEPGVPPAPWRFPARNRIIAALADTVLIVEARERSGALITVDLAMEIGRPIYAIPGETTSVLSTGTNQLIRDGHATLVSGAADILDDLTPKGVAR